MSNSFQNQEKEYQKRLYLTTSRFNHSCSPNCGYDFDDWSIRLYTLRNVQAGETMCISYSDVIYFFPRDKRRLYLRGSLKFDCACSACDTMNGSDIDNKSDKNRKQLKQIAIQLKYRVKATLYCAEFCMHVNEVIKEMLPKESESDEDVIDNDEKLMRHAQLVERARLRKLSKGIPIGQHDIDLIVKYIELLAKENVDFDMLPVYKLACDIALEAGGCNPPKEYWADKYLELLRCAKGPKHPETQAFLENYKIMLG